MSITTKTGDDGKSRWLGKVVDKDSPLLEAVGELDELQAVLGMVKMVERQKEIYEIMGELAYGKKINKIKNLNSKLENEINKLEKELKPVTKFLIFKQEPAVMLNWARTVCRRAERRLVTLNKVSPIDLNILIYFNRLSDYLFMMSRYKKE